MGPQPILSSGNLPRNHSPGKIPRADIPATLWAACKIVAGLCSFSIRICFAKRPRPWREDIQRALTRLCLSHLPSSVLRQPPPFSRLAKSERYGKIFPNLNQRIERPDFAGYWLCKPHFEKDTLPGEADVVILYAHGGAYTVFHPDTFSTLLLRMAETISAEGKPAAVFMLNYDFAPEFKFPTQLGQMSACWEYLTNEVNVSPSKIALMGDSSGASLCLSFLTHLACPLSGVKLPATPEKPGKGLFLLSPWVSLFGESGYAEQRESDVLDPKTIRRWAKSFVGDAKQADLDTYTEFTLPVRQRPGLNDILPAKSFVFAGADELFLANISMFVDEARNAGADVSFEVKPDKAHDWQFGEATINEQAHLRRPLGSPDNGLLSGCDDIGKLISQLE